MNYGSSYYGLRAFDQTTGVVHDASASVSATSSTAPVAWIVTLGSGEVIGTATSSATASGETFILQLSSEYSYSTGGYGTSAYGVDYLEFGTSASSSTASDSIRIRTATAICSASATNTVSARRVPQGSALVYGTSSNTVNSDANGTRIRTSPQLATVSGSVASDSTRVRESDSAIDAVATGSSFGVFIVSAESSISAVATNSCVPAATFAVSGSTDGTSSATALGDRILDCSTVSGVTESSSVCDPAATFAGSSASYGVTSTEAKAGYVKRSSVNVQCVLTIEANGRYKYEPMAKDNEIWNDVSASGGTWTEVA